MSDMTIESALQLAWVEIDHLRGCVAERDAEIERLRAIERDHTRTVAALHKAQDAAQHAAHVIIEAGVVPGTSCRCWECRTVAIGMADAGYLRGVPEAERWWLDAERAAEEAGKEKVR